MRGIVVYDPTSAVTGGLPLDRDPHLALVAAVLAWGPAPVGVRAADRAQIGLQLTGHARCAAADVRHRFEALPADSELRALTKSGAAGIGEPPLDRPRHHRRTDPEPGPAHQSPVPSTRPARRRAEPRAGHVIVPTA